MITIIHKIIFIMISCAILIFIIVMVTVTLLVILTVVVTIVIVVKRVISMPPCERRGTNQPQVERQEQDKFKKTHYYYSIMQGPVQEQSRSHNRNLYYNLIHYNMIAVRITSYYNTTPPGLR